jgi:hypothetical protein
MKMHRNNCEHVRVRLKDAVKFLCCDSVIGTYVGENWYTAC